MAQAISLTKALLQHCKLESETTADFAAQLKTLTDADKAWFRDRFTVEYGYEIA